MAEAQAEIPWGIELKLVTLLVSQSAVALVSIWIGILVIYPHTCKIIGGQFIERRGSYGEPDAEGRFFNRTEDDTGLDIETRARDLTVVFNHRASQILGIASEILRIIRI